MSRKTFFLSFIVCLLLSVQAQAMDKWELLYKPKQRVVKSIGIIDDSIFIGTANGIFVSKDQGETWTSFGNEHLPKDVDGALNINWIVLNKEHSDIYIATGYGVFYSSIDKPKWVNLFNSSKTEDLRIYSLALHKNQVFCATQDGLWRCDISQKSCTRFNSGIRPDPISSNYDVLSVLSYEDNLYATSTSGVYKYNNESESWISLNSGLRFLPDGRLNAKHLVVDPSKKLWLASGTGIYYSDNQGITWVKDTSGLDGGVDGFISANFLTVNNDMICAGLKDGLYCKDINKEEVWQDLSFGLKTRNEVKQVYWVAFNQSIAYAGTDEGLYVQDRTQAKPLDSGLVLKGQVESDFTCLEALEPSVIEVQKKALKFAALPSSFDYQKYKWLARLRNLFPRVVLDLNSTGTTSKFLQLDNGLSTDISFNNQFDAEKTFRQEHDGRTFKQVSLLWGANDFIYDDAVEDLLNHARLTANVRENILDDVTRIYYQRRGLQLEMLLEPPESTSAKLTRKLEVATLTGQIDSRTGGWFSREINKRKKKLGVRNNG